MGLTENYLSVPKKLIVELRDTPLAIALYFLIARLALVCHQAVPLSRSDIRVLDPTAKPGAIKRALDRLVRAGWLVESTSVGAKSTYWPVWGTSRAGTIYRWNITADRLGCPMYIWCDGIRIDRALLDLFIGKFTPHPRNAYLESFFTRPLLRLQDIGTYILLAAEVPIEATEELKSWGLVRDGLVQLVPGDTVVLALASQRASISGFQLTSAGWRKLGWFGARTGQPEELEGATTAPLIFVPKERIGGLIPSPIGQLIGGAVSEQKPTSASEKGETTLVHAFATMTGIRRDTRDTRDITPNPLYIADQQGGGSLSVGQKKSTGGPPIRAGERQASGEQVRGSEHAARTRHNETPKQDQTPLPDTEVVRLLWAIGARNRERLGALSETPVARVQEVIAAAQARPAVADKAGWVIAALSEGWDILPPPGTEDRDTLIDVTQYVTGQYGDLFRLGSDTSDLDWHLGSPECVQPSDQAHEQGPAFNLVQPGVSAAIQARPPNPRPPQPPADEGVIPRLAVNCRSGAELTQELRSGLLLRCDRCYHRTIRDIEVRVDDNTTVIYCASLADRLTILGSVMGVLRCLIADLRLPATIHVTDRSPPALESPAVGSRPAIGTAFLGNERRT